MDNNVEFRNLLLNDPETAVALLMKQHHSTLVALSEALTNDPAAAQDIVQEAFIHVWQNHKTLAAHHDNAIIYYIVRVVKNKSITQFKTNLRLRDLHSRYAANHTDLTKPTREVDLLKNEILAKLHDVIAGFPPKEKLYLEMKIFKKMTNADIAKHLNITIKAVEGRLTNARKRLRKYQNLFR